MKYKMTVITNGKCKDMDTELSKLAMTLKSQDIVILSTVPLAGSIPELEEQLDLFELQCRSLRQQLELLICKERIDRGPHLEELYKADKALEALHELINQKIKEVGLDWQ